MTVTGPFLKAETENQHKTDFERLNLDQSFKEFIWSRSPVDEAPDKSKIIAIVEANKIMSGLEFNFSKKSGDLLSITPILNNKDKNQDIQTISLWAFDSFLDGKITFDSLWDIVRTVSDDMVVDAHVFGLLASGLSTHEAKWIPILKGGPVEKAVHNLQMDKFIKDEKLFLIGMYKALY
jgi:hypothetical protein